MRSHQTGHWAAGAAVVFVVGALTAAAPAAAFDLTVTGVEVTQATQTPTNTIPLVETRSIAVRATLGVVDNGGAPFPGVTGRLHIFRDGTEFTSVAGIAPINDPFTAPVAPLRANENDTLNFEVPAPTGLPDSTNVDFRVDITPVAGEANTANNSGAANDLTVLEATAPTLYFTRVNFTAAGLGLPTVAAVSSPMGDAMVRGIMPVNDGDSDLYREGLFPTLGFNTDDGANNIIGDADDDIDDLLNLLEACRQLIDLSARVARRQPDPEQRLGQDRGAGELRQLRPDPDAADLRARDGA
jgi:hypothetical protein